MVFWWTRRLLGEMAAVMATLLFTFTPPVLAHAGLATTDMALTATFGAAFLAGLVWLENPSWKWTAILGVALAAATFSKFSFLVFFPASAAIAAIGVLSLIARPAGSRAFVWARLRAVGRGVGVRVSVDLGGISILVRQDSCAGVVPGHGSGPRAQSAGDILRICWGNTASRDFGIIIRWCWR